MQGRRGRRSARTLRAKIQGRPPRRCARASFLLLIQFLQIQQLEYQIDDEAEDEEVDDYRDKIPDAKSAECKIRKTFRASKDDTNERIHNVVHERLHQLLRGTTQDETDGKPRDPPLADERCKI